MKTLEYSYIRTEADNKYLLLLKSDKSWLDGELDINLTKDNQLSILLYNGDYLVTKELEGRILTQLKEQETRIYFLDENMKVLSDYVLPPCSYHSVNTSKNKP